jgi:hypothetical protein
MIFVLGCADEAPPEAKTDSSVSGGGYRRDVPGPSISFYYWKTIFNPGDESGNRLKQVAVERLYLRFFEVTLDERGKPVPQATVAFAQQPTLPVVPVIYLENSVFGSDILDESDLADKLFDRVAGMIEAHELKAVKELHLDCDWTSATRESFFAFAAALKKKQPPGWQLAVTLRLDQFHNFSTTGVPPADKGILMAYNMGNLRQPGRHNSIIEPAIAARYLKGNGQYPLPLDIALPLFSWVVVFNDQDQFQGLLRTVPPELADSSLCVDDGGGLFTAKQSFHSSGGTLIPAGWRLRLEEPGAEDLLAVADLLRQAVPQSEFLVFYHMDESIIRRWPADVLESIAGRCH